MNLITGLADSTFPAIAAPKFNVMPVYVNNLNDSTIPVVNMVGTPVVDYHSVNVTFNLTNMQGLVYVGILAVPQGGLISLPNKTQLVQGYDGNATALLDIQYLMLQSGGSGTVNFTTVTNSTNYTIYYQASNLDVSINSLNSAVFYYHVITSPLPGSFGSVIQVSMMLVAFLLMGLLGMF